MLFYIYTYYHSTHCFCILDVWYDVLSLVVQKSPIFALPDQRWRFHVTLQRILAHVDSTGNLIVGSYSSLTWIIFNKCNEFQFLPFPPRCFPFRSNRCHFQQQSIVVLKIAEIQQILTLIPTLTLIQAEINSKRRKKIEKENKRQVKHRPKNNRDLNPWPPAFQSYTIAPRQQLDSGPFTFFLLYWMHSISLTFL